MNEDIYETMSEETVDASAPPETPVDAPAAQDNTVDVLETPAPPDLPIEAPATQDNAELVEKLGSLIDLMSEQNTVEEEPQEEMPAEEWEEIELVEYATREDLQQLTALVEQAVDRPFLTTPFEEYTVTEGFCLLFLVGALCAVLGSAARRCFGW